MNVNGQHNPTLMTRVFAAAREQYQQSARDISNYYKMARRTRHTRPVRGSSSGESADQDYSSESEYYMLVALGRQYDRDDILAGAVVNRLVDNVFQSGFEYLPATGNKQADQILKERFWAYESSPQDVDISKEHDLHTLARMYLRESIVSGDILATKVETGHLQTFEAHRCKTPSDLPADSKRMCIHGVQLDGLRRRTAYYFAEDDIAITSRVLMKATRKIPAFDDAGFRNVLHIYHPRRATQTRGVTKFAPIGDAIPMHSDIQFAKMVQQQNVSAWALLRERGLGFEYPDGITTAETIEDDPCAPGQTRSIQHISPGMMYTTFPGEKVSGFSPNVPNPTFFDHARQMQQLIGINLDIPLVMLLLDASETNFSGFRGALEQAKISFLKLQWWFANCFYREVALWQLRLWSDPNSPLADPFIVDLRESGINIFAHEWGLPKWPYLQPVEDATADKIKLRTGMTSLRRAHADRGLDYDTVMQEIIGDRKAMIVSAKQAAAEINAAFPDDKEPASWRDLAVLPTSEGETLALPSVQPERMQKPAEIGALTHAE